MFVTRDKLHLINNLHIIVVFSYDTWLLKDLVKISRFHRHQNKLARMILYLITTQFILRIHLSVELTDTLQDKMYLTYILNLMRS